MMTELSAYPARQGAEALVCGGAGSAVSADGSVDAGKRIPARVRFIGVGRNLESIAA
ncbi:hypothetical protein HZS55_16730 [Halosimplex rubrum]|uniref:Uncharacterized protein n=1 Tax=Halosimplex rubrum TaxID=869889 RepID=A0A7D5TQG3_9EURY|nr:hypothetical protein [Halosimplex rubrum]QLH78834.1 hypothetical protein HZS55_16730 [Halosimplex rubrum]